MTLITTQEVLKIAEISHIKLPQDKIEHITKELEQVLNYAQRVTEVVSNITAVNYKNINIFREDLAIPKDSTSLINQAPEHMQHYFVVPLILDSNT